MQQIDYVAVIEGQPVRRTYHERMRETGIVARKTPTPAILEAMGLEPLYLEDKPTLNAGEIAERSTVPTKNMNGEWVLGWTVRAETAQELADAKARRHAELASRRWTAETGGMTFGGAPVATDDRSKALIYGASGRSVPHFKVAPGTFISLTDVETAALAEAVAAHVQSCFDNEATLAGQIEAATTIAAVEAVDIETGWPA